MIPVDRAGPPAKKIVTIEYIKEVMGWTVARMKELKRGTTSAVVAKDAVVRAMRAALKDFGECQPELSGKPEEAYAPHVWSANKLGTECTLTTSFAIPEVRLVLTGEVRFFGVELGKVHGTGMAEKVSTLQHYTKMELEAAVKKHGFHTKLGPGCALVIPPKFALVTLATELTHGVKWSFKGSEKNMTEGSAPILDDLLKAYQSLEGTTHDHLHTMVLLCAE
jgi:hypothetical protein